MQDISKTLIAIMEVLHCDVMTALIYLRREENVSDILRLSEPLSDQYVSEQSDNKSGGESSR